MFTPMRANFHRVGIGASQFVGTVVGHRLDQKRYLVPVFRSFQVARTVAPMVRKQQLDQPRLLALTFFHGCAQILYAVDAHPRLVVVFADLEKAHL